MHASAVGRAIVVQAVGPYGFDNRYLLHSVADHPQLAAVPAVDLDGRSSQDIERAVQRLAESPRVVGVRYFAVSPGSTWTPDETRSAAAFEAAFRAGLVVVLTVFAHQLRGLTDLLIGRNIPVALDHCGLPELSGGRLRNDAPLLALREASHVVLKVTTHLLRDAAVDGDPVRLVDQLIEEFGADRLLWGSDYPQTSGDYPDLLAAAEAATKTMGPDERRGFFAANAARVFRRPGLW
jgi:predicted TIM-barrel fold metal-dependent hydrolase